MSISSSIGYGGNAFWRDCDSLYLLLDVMTIVGLIETTVRPIEDTPWIPVVREEEEHMDTSTDDIIPSAYKEKLLPLRVDLPPSLLPVHSSVFDSVPPCDWG